MSELWILEREVQSIRWFVGTQIVYFIITLGAMVFMTPEALARRNALIRAAWDDPLRRALMSAKKSIPGSKRSSRAAYNAYYRSYRQRRKHPISAS